MNNKKNKIEYLEAANKIGRFNLVIVGQDPYLTSENGIAFCKNSFDDFFDEYCCGKEVLFSLGYAKDWIVSNYNNPIELFIDLLAKGIAFINVSSVLVKFATEESLKEDANYNENFLSKADKIIILGKSKATTLFKQHYPNYKVTTSLIHPSGKAKKYNEVEWTNVWRKQFLKNNYLF